MRSDQAHTAAGEAAPTASEDRAPLPAAALSLEDFIHEGPILFPVAPPAPQLLVGVVIGAGDRLACECGGAQTDALRAPSCLLEPQVGDRVLVCRAAGACYALAVLERSAAPAVLKLPEAARIEGKRVALAADCLRVAAGETTVKSARLTVRGVLARLDFTFLSVKARELVRIAGNFLSRSRAHRAEAEDAMRISAPDLRLDARECLRARAGTIDLKAEGPAKMDGSTVQLG
ncbi:MAG: DUF3540 domain-containing protein [Deltaproteobacteria bacterium]|jgi:hypothetical protein|nr:DUF3540 domain-containing protein [Deltaproteobacteria bacterium]